MNLKHGDSRTTEYERWGCMIQRCCNPKHKSFKNYGGRGIKVCKRWRDYRNFLADMGRCPAGMTLDRRNNDGDYKPSNCRWATPKQQVANRRQQIYPPHCPHGHEYTVENTFIEKTGWRKCLTCIHQRLAKKWRERK